MPLLSCWRKARPLASEDQIVSESEPLRSSHPGSIGSATPRAGSERRAVNRVAIPQQLPASAQPANAIGQVSIARRTLDARKCTAELCRHFLPVFALSEGERRNTRHNPEVGIMAIFVGQRHAQAIAATSLFPEFPRDLDRRLAAPVEEGHAEGLVGVIGQVRSNVEVGRAVKAKVVLGQHPDCANSQRQANTLAVQTDKFDACAPHAVPWKLSNRLEQARLVGTQNGLRDAHRAAGFVEADALREKKQAVRRHLEDSRVGGAKKLWLGEYIGCGRRTLRRKRIASTGTRSSSSIDDGPPRRSSGRREVTLACDRIARVELH